VKYKLDTAETIRYNNEPYHLRIRSNDEKNPVVLFLHGGPGSPDRPWVMKYQSSLADVCAIVAWDQRGAGLAYSKKLARIEAQTMTKEQYINDTHNVMQYLKERFKQDRIIIAGHSFGSWLGVWVAQRFPEDIAAFVGTGQCVDIVRHEAISFDFAMKEAVRRGDKRVIKKLYSVGPPVNGFYKDGKVGVQRKILEKYGGIHYGKYAGWMMPSIFKEYSPVTWLNFMKGNRHCHNSPMGKERVNFIEEARELDIPVYLFMGRHDYNTPFVLAEEWYDILRAPYKQFIWFEKSGHSPQYEEPEAWNSAFARYVLKTELGAISLTNAEKSA